MAESPSLELTEEERVTLRGLLGSYLPDEAIGDASEQERWLLDWYRGLYDALETTNVLAVDKDLLDWLEYPCNEAPERLRIEHRDAGAGPGADAVLDEHAMFNDLLARARGATGSGP